MKKLIILFMCVLFIIPLILSVPPVSQVQQFTEGYTIVTTPIELLKQNNNFTFNFFLYNISNGLNVGGASISCYFYLADNQGTLKYESNPSFSNGYYNLFINGANFSEVGHYSYGVRCNSSELGGAYVSYYEVSPQGYILSDSQSYLIIFILILIFLIALMFFIFGLKLENIGVKVFSLSFTVILSVFLIGYSLTMVNNFLGEFTFITDSFTPLYIIFITLLSVGGVGLILFLIYVAFDMFYKYRGLKLK